MMKVRNLPKLQMRKLWNLCIACMAVSFLDPACGQEDIRMPPSITKGPSPQHIIYRSDDKVSLDCKGKGVPGVRYEWKKNDFDLNPYQPNIDRGVDGTITINNAAASDEGYYQCFARNQYGTALSNTVHIQRAVLDSASGTPQTLPKTVVEGLPFHIQSDPRKSFPKPTYGWEMASNTVDKNPVPLRPSRRIQIAENGDLHFAYALPEDSLDGKLYKCITYNPYLDIKAGGSYTQLTVTRNPGGLAPFNPTLGFASLEQTVAVIGRSATLRCFFSGYPEPTIQWTGPRNTLPIGRYALNNFNSELVINNITAGDQGDYTCAGSNTQGRTRHVLQIRVEEVPVFPTVKDGPYDANVTEGESLTFNCIANAKPDATIVWLQDGVVLDPNNPPKRFAFSGNRKSLTIREVCRNCGDREKQTDLTVIQCNASNIHGYAFSSGYVNVLLKTTVILVNDQDVRVEMYDEKEVKFECNATSDPSTPPTVRWYKVENNEEQPVQNDPPTVTLKDGALTIFVSPNGTQKWTKYHGEYRCTGDNGYSKATASVQLIVEEYEPPVVSAGYGYAWIWVIVGITCILLVLAGIFYAFFGQKCDKGAKHSNTVSEAKGRHDAPGTELSYALYDTIADDQYVNLESHGHKPTIQTSTLGGVGIKDRPSGRTEAQTAPSVLAVVSSRSTTVDAATQTESTRTKCYCGQSGIAPTGQQSGGDYMALTDRDQATASTYADLHQLS